MTQLVCPACRVRFSRTAYPPSECPECDGSLVSLSAEKVLGLRLHTDREVLELPLAAAIAAARVRLGLHPA